MTGANLTNSIPNPVQNDQAPTDIAPAITIAQDDHAPSSSLSPTMSITLRVYIQAVFPIIGGHHVIQSDGGDV